jgi:hypothetical protein
MQDTDESTQSPPKITEVIQSGLELQEYMQKNTNFFKLYLQEIKPDCVQYKTKKKRFVSQGTMMLKLFLKKNKHAA